MLHLQKKDHSQERLPFGIDGKMQEQSILPMQPQNISLDEVRKMRLIYCRKCGAALVTEDALIERMNDTIHELNEKARHSKNGKIAKSYLAEAASVTKMMKGILHNTASMEARKSGSSYELAEIIHYIRENNLISDEKLDELRKTARARAKIRNEENQKEIDRIYGKYRGSYIPSNNTKSDKTAEIAIRNAGK